MGVSECVRGPPVHFGFQKASTLMWSRRLRVPPVLWQVEETDHSICRRAQ